MNIKEKINAAMENADDVASKLKNLSQKDNVIMPSRYKKIKEAIPKDANLPRNLAIYNFTNNGTNATVLCFSVTEEESMDFDKPEDLINMIHNEMCDENRGLIEVGSGVAAHGGKYIYHIMKSKKILDDEVIGGVTYSLNFNIQINSSIQFINGSFDEAGATGMRDALVMAMIPSKDNDPFNGWSKDPYDENFKKGFLMNLSEESKFDEMFPDHPLTEIRRLISEVIATEYSHGFSMDKLAIEPKKQADTIAKAVGDIGKVSIKAIADVSKIGAKAVGDVGKTVGDVGKAGAEAAKEKIKKYSDNKVESDKINVDCDEKREKLDDKLRHAIDAYNNAYTLMNDHGNVLYLQRERSIDALQNVENLINSIANHPKEFDKEIEEIVKDREKFKQSAEYAKQELEAAQKSAMTAGAGVAAGAAVVSIVPSVAMWVATTFGTASTGTAITTLSGAAATNAALAWLGGGTLAMGGGGMAGGTAFLALAGPVGWGIAGATLLASIALFSNKKLKLDKQKSEEIESVLRNTEQIKEVDVKIEDLLDKTTTLRDALNIQYGNNLWAYKKDYVSLSKTEQLQLGTMVNVAKSLAMMLCEGV